MSPKILLAAALVSAALSAEITLIDFANAEAVEKLDSKDVVKEAVKGAHGPALRVTTGTSWTWPSIYIRKEGGYDLSAFGMLTIPVKNLLARPVTVFCRIDSMPRSGEGKRMSKTFQVMVEGEREDALRIPLLPIKNSGGVKAADFFGMRGIPFIGGDAMHLENILEVVVFVNNLKEPWRLEYGNPVASGANAATTLPEKPFPFIDAFGQFMHKTWPGKIKDEADLKSRFGLESKDLEANPRPADWNSWGGWSKGPSLKGTGFFRAEKVDGKWWLVDPTGRLFFSHGVDCVHLGDWTAVDDREKWFSALPPEDGAFAAAHGKGRTHMAGYYYQGKNFKTVSFFVANLIRKYPEPWRSNFIERTLSRLPSWGLNTIANWSREEIYLKRRVPYTATLGTSAPEIAGTGGYWGKFKDVFHPDFKENLKKRLAGNAAVGDPWCMGFFVDNEMSWGDDTSLALGTLASPGSQMAKKVFVDDLKARYGDIEKLNVKWGTQILSWEALLANEVKPDKAKAREDLTNFYAKISATYFRGVRDVLKEAAPNQLYLGCRFAWDNDLVIRVSREFCDVVSFNIYGRSPLEKGKAIAMAGDKPVIIGEFHFGALDRGQFHTGLVPVKDQNERAAAYTRYVTDALNHPNLVGTHWFQYMDSPTLGRTLDGENYQIGFLDNADTTYPELVAASRGIGKSMYGMRAKK